MGNFCASVDGPDQPSPLLSLATVVIHGGLTSYRDVVSSNNVLLLGFYTVSTDVKVINSHNN